MKEKIGIISDTHGLLRPEVLEILKDCINMFTPILIRKENAEAYTQRILWNCV